MKVTIQRTVDVEVDIFNSLKKYEKLRRKGGNLWLRLWPDGSGAVMASPHDYSHERDYTVLVFRNEKDLAHKLLNRIELAQGNMEKTR